MSDVPEYDVFMVPLELPGPKNKLILVNHPKKGYNYLLADLSSFLKQKTSRLLLNEMLPIAVFSKTPLWETIPFAEAKRLVDAIDTLDVYSVDEVFQQHYKDYTGIKIDQINPKVREPSGPEAWIEKAVVTAYTIMDKYKLLNKTSRFVFMVLFDHFFAEPQIVSI
eukprot:UN00248